MKIKRIMIAAPKSGSGKTTITCALLQALKNKGEDPVAFKCGPDYIDPMFHEKALGVPSYNLDTFFTGRERTRELFENHAAGEKVAVMEGVMGLYDGLGGIREEGSSYHLAKITGTPVVLVADVKGMGRSVLPFLAGFLQYDREHLIRGVILNRISEGFYETIKPLIEKELHLPVAGFLPEKEGFHVGSRHLGLVMPDELEGIKSRLSKLSAEFEKTVSLPDIMRIAEGAGDLDGNVGWRKSVSESAQKAGPETKPVIAVARDEAFCFYYRDNLLLLQEYGAKLIWFSPLHDEKLPDVCNALLIGGGYPELYAEKLSKNISMRRSVREAVERGMPVVAECGGFMYLHGELIDRGGTSYAMAGVIPAKCYDTGKLVRFGYIEMQEKKSCFLPEDSKIKGHEFHYYDSTCNGEDIMAVKPVTGKGYFCVIEEENKWMGFPHLYYPSNPVFAKSFVEKAGEYGKEI